MNCEWNSKSNYKAHSLNSKAIESKSKKKGSKVFLIESVTRDNNGCWNEKYHSGQWTVEEHKKFIEAINKYGNSWRKIEAYVGTRTRTQIKSHCQKYYENIRDVAIKREKRNHTKQIFIVYRS